MSLLGCSQVPGIRKQGTLLIHPYQSILFKIQLRISSCCASIFELHPCRISMVLRRSISHSCSSTWVKIRKIFDEIQRSDVALVRMSKCCSYRLGPRAVDISLTAASFGARIHVPRTLFDPRPPSTCGVRLSRFCGLYDPSYLTRCERWLYKSNLGSLKVKKL